MDWGSSQSLFSRFREKETVYVATSRRNQTYKPETNKGSHIERFMRSSLPTALVHHLKTLEKKKLWRFMRSSLPTALVHHLKTLEKKKKKRNYGTVKGSPFCKVKDFQSY